MESLEVLKGNLIIKTKDNEEIKIAQKLGIQVNPYDLTEDGELTSSDNNLLLMEQDGTLTLPDSVKKIGNGAFSGVVGLKILVIPESVTEIGNNAFSNNETLEKVIIKGNLQKIGDYAFNNAKNLKEINLPDSINYIGQYAFSGASITNIILPKNLKNVDSETFSGCRNLANITLNEGLETIAFSAFQSCPIEQIAFPKSLNEVSESAFRYCDNLKNVDTSKNPNFIFENGMLLNSNRDKIVFITKEKLSGSETFEIPEGIVDFKTSIRLYSNIKTIILPSTLQGLLAVSLPETIENVKIKDGNTHLKTENGVLYNERNALLMCYDKEKNIVIPEGIQTITNYGFWQATNAETVTFPETLESIGIWAFTNCYYINTINIGKNVKDIAPDFYSEETYYTKNLNIDSNNPYYIVENNILYKKENGKKKTLVCVMKKIDSGFSIEKETVSIGDKAFYKHNEIEELTISDGIQNIGKEVFRDCKALKKINLPKTISQIDDEAFKNCVNLEEININNKTNSISGAPWGASKGLKAVKWNN